MKISFKKYSYSLCYCGVKHLLKEILFQIHINMKLIMKKGFLKHISRPPWLAQPQYLLCSTTAKHTIGDKIIRAEEVNDFDGRTAAVVDGRSVARCKKLTSIGKGHLQCWTTKNPLIWRKFNLTFTSHLKSNNEYHVAVCS